MKLQLRQKSKREQSLDAFASVAKTWSEWHLGKKVSKTAAKGAKQAAKVKGTSKATGLKIAGAIALVGAAGAAVAKKFKGGQAEPLYTPPGPAPDMAPPPPSAVAVEDLAKDPSAGDTMPVPPTVEPAITASTEIPPQDPTQVVVGDLEDAAPADIAPAAQDEPMVDPPALLPDMQPAPEPDDEPPVFTEDDDKV